MPYQVISQDQFRKLRDNGYSVEKIAEFEKKRMAESGGTATMEQPQESPLRESYREGLGQSAHGISQIAFGAPEMIANKISPKLKEAVFPEPRTTEGKIFRMAMDIYSMFGGGAAKLATGAITAGLKGGFKELAKKTLSEKVKRTAAGGAVYGGTQLDPESTIGGQALKAGVGAVGGAGLTLGGAGLVKSGQFLGGIPSRFKSFKQIPELEKEVSVIKSRQEQLNLEKGNIGLQKEEIFGQGENISGRAKRLETRAGRTAKGQIEHEQEVTNLLVKDTKETLEHNTEVLRQDLRAKAESGELKLKDTLGEFGRANSEGYKTTLTKIEDNLSKTGQELRISETNQIIENTLNKFNASLIPDGNAREGLQALKNKYGVKLVGESNKFIRASTGQSVGGAIRSNANDTIKLSDFLNDIREFRKVLSAGAKSGSKRWTHEDTAVANLNNEWSTFLEGRTGLKELKELNGAYKPVIDTMNEANRLFAPNKGEFTGVRGGVSYLERFAKEKSAGMALKTEEEFLRSIEQGSQFSQGVGGITDELVNIARQVKKAEARVTPVLDSIKAASKTRVGSINQKLANRLDKLSQRKEYISKNYLGKERAIQAELQSHMKNLGFKEDQLKLLLADKSKMYKVLTTLGLGTVGLGGAGVTGNRLSQFFRGE